MAPPVCVSLAEHRLALDGTCAHPSMLRQQKQNGIGLIAHKSPNNVVILGTQSKNNMQTPKTAFLRR